MATLLTQCTRCGGKASGLVPRPNDALLTGCGWWNVVQMFAQHFRDNGGDDAPMVRKVSPHSPQHTSLTMLVTQGEGGGGGDDDDDSAERSHLDGSSVHSLVSLSLVDNMNDELVMSLPEQCALALRQLSNAYANRDNMVREVTYSSPRPATVLSPSHSH